MKSKERGRHAARLQVIVYIQGKMFYKLICCQKSSKVFRSGTVHSKKGMFPLLQLLLKKNETKPDRNLEKIST